MKRLKADADKNVSDHEEAVTYDEVQPHMTTATAHGSVTDRTPATEFMLTANSAYCTPNIN